MIDAISEHWIKQLRSDGATLMSIVTQTGWGYGTVRRVLAGLASSRVREPRVLPEGYWSRRRDPTPEEIAERCIEIRKRNGHYVPHPGGAETDS